jgi:hypothetical protein
MLARVHPGRKPSLLPHSPHDSGISHPHEANSGSLAIDYRIKRKPEITFYFVKSKDYHILRLGTLLTLHLGKANALSFFQGLETLTLNRTEMNEQITSVFTLNEAESLAFVEPFNGSLLLL